MNIKDISNITNNAVFDEPMKNHTTFKIGGPADAYITPESVEEIQQIISFCKENGIPFMIMGNGSNMLVSDKGIRGAVIQVGKKMSGIDIDGTEVTAQAGVLLSTLANRVLKDSLSGIEFASGIPGTLGGGIYMNAGAYGGELKDVIKSVTCITPGGSIQTLSGDELKFGYRHSVFEEGGYVILSCKMELKHGVYEEIKAQMTDYSKRRIDKQPLEYPSAGSTFKRPEGHFAGKLIQDAELMGCRVGGAEVSKKHAGFIINSQNATAEDVLNLIKKVQDKVYEKFGVRLEPEVRLIGER